MQVPRGRRAHLPQGMAHEPLGVVAGEWLAHVPRGLDEHRLERVHRDVVVGAAAAGVHAVVAVPVLVIPPVCCLHVKGARVLSETALLQQQGDCKKVLPLTSISILPRCPMQACSILTLYCQLKAAAHRRIARHQRGNIVAVAHQHVRQPVLALECHNDDTIMPGCGKLT